MIIRKVFKYMIDIMNFLAYNTASSNSIASVRKIRKPKPLSKAEECWFATKKIILNKNSRMYKVKKDIDDE